MPPCLPSRPLARLGGQFFQLLSGKKGPASRLQPLGRAGRDKAGLEKSAPHSKPQSPVLERSHHPWNLFYLQGPGQGDLVVKLDPPCLAI